MNTAHLFDQIQFHLLLHGPQYKFYIEVATVAVLFLVGLTDFRSFKIRNDVVVLLFVLYIMFAVVARSRPEIISNFILAALMFVVLLWFYTYGVVGGGDVKFMTVVSLWIGIHCALIFSLLLLTFIALHTLAAKFGWVATKLMHGRNAIPYAPSVAAALIITIMLGCL